jgi:hypothetical protein
VWIENHVFCSEIHNSPEYHNLLETIYTHFSFLKITWRPSGSHSIIHRQRRNHHFLPIATNEDFYRRHRLGGRPHTGYNTIKSKKYCPRERRLHA